MLQVFNQFFETPPMHQILRFYGYLHTATTSIFRQINTIFPFCGIEVGDIHWLKSELQMRHTKHSVLKVPKCYYTAHLYVGQAIHNRAIHNRAIHCIVDQMVGLAIRWSWFTKDNHLRSGTRYANAFPVVIIFILIHRIWHNQRTESGQHK